MKSRKTVNSVMLFVDWEFQLTFFYVSLKHSPMNFEKKKTTFFIYIFINTPNSRKMRNFKTDQSQFNMIITLQSTTIKYFFIFYQTFTIRTKLLLLLLLATLVEGDPNAPFLITTTLRCRGRHYSFPWTALLYPWSLPYNAEC